MNYDQQCVACVARLVHNNGLRCDHHEVGGNWRNVLVGVDRIFLFGKHQKKGTTMMMTAIAILYMIHKALIDVKMWTRMPDQRHICERYWYLIGDGVYLGGTVLMYFGIAVTAWHYGMQQMAFGEIIRCLVVGALIGSEIWDLIFGWIVNADPFYAFSDWYGGYGFKNKMQRYVFDVIRVLMAIGVYNI